MAPCQTEKKEGKNEKEIELTINTSEEEKEAVCTYILRSFF